MYLRGWNTQQDVADEYDVSRPKIKSAIKNVESSTCGEIYNNFEPLLYNIWNLKTPTGGKNSTTLSFNDKVKHNTQKEMADGWKYELAQIKRDLLKEKEVSKHGQNQHTKRPEVK
jgi:hypothetical protein